MKNQFAIFAIIIVFGFIALFAGGNLLSILQPTVPHIIHEYPINEESGTVTINSIMDPTKVLGIVVSYTGCKDQNSQYWYLDNSVLINAKLYPLNNPQTCNNLHYEDVAGQGAYQHYDAVAAGDYVPGLQSKTITYELQRGYEEVCSYEGGRCVSRSKIYSSTTLQPYKIYVYEQVECTSNSQCVEAAQYCNKQTYRCQATEPVVSQPPANATQPPAECPTCTAPPLNEVDGKNSIGEKIIPDSIPTPLLVALISFVILIIGAPIIIWKSR